MLKAVLEGVSAEFAGRDVETVKEVLSAQWSAVGDGARVTQPDLTAIATRISLGKRVWLEPDGRVVSEA